MRFAHLSALARCRFLALLAGLLLAPLAQATKFSVAASGPELALTLTGEVEISEADFGQPGSFYLAARLADLCFVHDGVNWQLWNGGALPAYWTGLLTNRRFEVAHGVDATALVGAELWLGYGRDEADMFAAGKYAQAYRFVPSADLARSILARDLSPVVTQTDQVALTAGNGELACALYRQLRKDEALSGRNIFFSPISISLALAMTQAGARGATADEMAQALHLSLPAERLHAAFGWLDLQLASRGRQASGMAGHPFRLNVTNALWGDQRTPFEAAFLDTLAVHYGTGVYRVDFVQAPEDSRLRINDWVADKTEQKITGLIPQGTIDASTRFVLVNAVYFNAAWQRPFDRQATEEGASFTRLDGTKQRVAMMRQRSALHYAENADGQIVELPYDGGELAMLVLLPKAGAFTRFEQDLSASRLTALRAAMTTHQVNLGLPRFRVDSHFSVKNAMRALGMRLAFTTAADFSGISNDPAEPLRISDVLHQAFAKVDEEGTEAAAATAVIGVGTGLPPPPPEVNFIAERPFLIAIVDQATGTLVFLGALFDPAS